MYGGEIVARVGFERVRPIIVADSGHCMHREMGERA